MAILNLVLTQQSYSEEKNGAHAHYREPVPLSDAAVSPDEMQLGKLKINYSGVPFRFSKDKYLHDRYLC